MHKLFIFIGLFFLGLIVIGFLVGSYKSYKTAGKKEGSESLLPGINWNWSLPVQAAAAIALITTIGLLFFKAELIDLWVKNPAMIFILFAAALGMLIGGDSLKTINVCRKIALIVLVVMIAYFGAWPKWSEPKSSATATSATTHDQAPAKQLPRQEEVAPQQQLPANAVFVKTLAPGERIYLTRTSMDAPPPICWSQDSTNGRATITESAWPNDSRYFYVINDIANPINIYTVGQQVTASMKKPEIAVDSATAAYAAPAEISVRSTPRSMPNDPFNGKYQWNGQVGYPEDR